MMLQSDTEFTVELLALFVGSLLLICGSKEGLKYSGFAIVVAYFTIVTSILAIFLILISTLNT